MIYVASRVKHAARWRDARADGVPINSSWIDEAGEGETKSFSLLWERIVREVESADALLLYVEPDDFPLKGALVEVGVAMHAGKAIYLCMPGVVLEGRTSRPIGSWINHPLVTRIDHPWQCFEREKRWKQVAPKQYTPDELRAQISKMMLRRYPDGPTDQNWILNVGIGTGMLSVAADQIEKLERELREHRS